MSLHRFLPEWLILAREARGMKVGEVASAADVPMRTLQAVELGDAEVTPSELRRIANAMGYPTSFFLRTDEPSDASVPHLHCLADDAKVAEIEEPMLRARLRCLVRDLSARSLRDAVLAIKDIRARELREIEEATR